MAIGVRLRVRRALSTDERSITPADASTAFVPWGVRLPVIRLAGLLIALAAVVAMELFLNRTYRGKAIRAIADCVFPAPPFDQR